jgi:soluble lytic murein transglycosylase
MTISLRIRATLACPLLSIAAVAFSLGGGAAQAQSGLPAANAAAASAGDDVVVDAREALRRKDRVRLASARASLMASNHPLAMWADYWELNNRLSEATQEELDAFYARWPNTYVEDRLRNDWLLELGHRRDWANLRAEYPKFRMNDDREVTCYALLTRHLQGEDVAEEARAAWFAQRDTDDGCGMLGAALVESGKLSPEDVWRKLRLLVEANRGRPARQAASLLGEDIAIAVGDLHDNPQRYLQRKASTRSRSASELTTLALIRSADNDPPATARQLEERWAKALPPDLVTWLWASIGKEAAQKLLPEASDHFQRASLPRGGAQVELPDDTLAWKLRAALRANNGAGRWQQVMQAVTAMSRNEQKDSAWIYWKARALKALARDSQDGEALREQARTLLEGIASPLHFYGKLAAEELGQPLAFPPRPAPLTAEERVASLEQPGLRRALLLIGIGLRNEGVREWNYSLRGMGERQLLAAAQLACDRQVWDRCINTSERTREQVDIEQRFPLPFRAEVLAQAQAMNIDPAYVYGLIRQESRFVPDARSGAGASGLMQIMPSTAKWTARKLGMSYVPASINERDTNLRIGTGYLKLVLDSFEGSQAMAAAAYNAGPSRPRRWREGPALDPVVWAENIPYPETRDYVKKVLSNATDYAAIISGQPQSLRTRLGLPIGSPSPSAAAAEDQLP